ncbi:MAG: DUF1993 domain-containing protein [Patescibacteria group bacterium]
MKYPLYEVSIPVFIRSLESLRKIVRKAARYAPRKKIKMSTLLTARLAPDMYTLTQQVQYAYFMALETAVNLSGRPMPQDFKYDEKTLTELDHSLKKAIAFLKTITPRSCASTTGTVKTFLHPTKKFKKDFYATQLALPNFFFHVTTAYDILRSKGIPLKKDDYLGF